MAEQPKTNVGLVAHAQKWLGEAYWYGTCCYACTTSLLNSKKQQYPSHYTDSRMSQYQQNIRDKKHCADCIGLIKGYYWEKDGKVVYDRNTDVNTGGLYDRSAVKGVITTLPETPGLILYKPGHVGVYEGNGSVIEAKGFSSGIVRSDASRGPWTHWIACPFISYEGYEDQLIPPSGNMPYIATVVTKASPLNIWKDSSKTTSLLRVDKGDFVQVIDHAMPIGWLKVKKNGVVGVADGQYLAKSDAPPVQDDVGDKDPELPVDPDDNAPVLYQANVSGVSIGLNLRSSPTLTTNTITLLSEGVIVDVVDEDAGGGFAYVCYGDIYGYVTKRYLKRVDGAPDALYDAYVKGITADAVARLAKAVPGMQMAEAE